MRMLKKFCLKIILRLLYLEKIKLLMKDKKKLFPFLLRATVLALAKR